MYLHDNKLKQEGQLSDLSWRQVKQERRIPQSTGASFSFSAADHDSFIMQIDHHLVFCAHKDYKCERKSIVEQKLNMTADIQMHAGKKWLSNSSKWKQWSRVRMPQCFWCKIFSCNSYQTKMQTSRHFLIDESDVKPKPKR